MRRTHQVKDVAALAGVSVRTLHHYDAIGILRPSARTEAGYRLYDDDDLLRLQQILIGRALGLSLERIRRSLDDPSFDRRAALVAQRRELEARASETTRMIRAIDHALTALDSTTEKEFTMTIDPKEIFDGFDPGAYEAEARTRWGSSESFAIAAARSKRYGEGDWRALKAEQSAIYDDLARAMGSGASLTSEAVVAIVLRHRMAIERWFYPCSEEMHLRLADLYENDWRFAANIDVHGEGLTEYLVAAIRARTESSTE